MKKAKNFKNTLDARIGRYFLTHNTKKCFVTSDNTIFHNKHNAQQHANTIKGDEEDKEVEVYNRANCADIIAAAKAERDAFHEKERVRIAKKNEGRKDHLVPQVDGDEEEEDDEEEEATETNANNEDADSSGANDDEDNEDEDAEDDGSEDKAEDTDTDTVTEEPKDTPKKAATKKNSTRKNTATKRTAAKK